MYSFATRRSERVSLFVMADIRFESDPAPIRVAVRNLSAKGMMVERDRRVTRGERVTVQLRNTLPMRGTVVWTRAPRFGIAFDRELDLEAAQARTLPPRPPRPV